MKETKCCLFAATLMTVSAWLAPVSALAQTQTASSKTPVRSQWTSARLPDGQPDIQGMWSGGASFADASFPRPQTTAGPPGVDCNAKYKLPTGLANTECAAYVGIFTGVVDGK